MGGDRRLTAPPAPSVLWTIVPPLWPASVGRSRSREQELGAGIYRFGNKAGYASRRGVKPRGSSVQVLPSKIACSWSLLVDQDGPPSCLR